MKVQTIVEAERVLRRRSSVAMKSQYNYVHLESRVAHNLSDASLLLAKLLHDM